MLDFKKVQLKVLENERALYSFAELKEYIDWEIKRVYFLQDFKNDTGQHCHKEEKEFFIMVKGSCKAVIDQGKGREDIELKGPGDGILVGNYVWHGFKDFSADAIVLALSSTNYNPDRSDYIGDYTEYQETIKK